MTGLVLLLLLLTSSLFICSALAGFSASSSSSPHSAEAKTLLSQCNKDISAASKMHFNQQVEKLDSKTQYLLQKKGPSVNDLLATLTWDSVALFLPPSPPAPKAGLKSKLKSIAKACSGSICDVGCGDGNFIPYLKRNKGFDDYLGIDSSPLVIKLAEANYPKLSFSAETFNSDFERPGEKSETVLFSASLQLFQDWAGALKFAKGLLTEDGGRIVITQVNGAAFVKEERKLNPDLVLSILPTEEELEKVAGELGI